MNFGSLFAGIGGLDLGLERAGMTCSWQVEIDDYASRVLAKHWPDVRRWDDVKTFPPEGDWSVDLICGGFPCQDISFAGKGAGIHGARSGLFFEAIRVVEVIKPRWVLLENVAALLVRGLPEVLGTLASIGFDAEWHCIPAASVGAPHIRDRVFVLAYPSGQRGWGIQGRERTGEKQRTEGTSEDIPILRNSESINRRNQQEDAGDGYCRESRGIFDAAGSNSGNVADAASIRCPEMPDGPRQDGQHQTAFKRWVQQPSRDCWWDIEPAVGRVADGVSNRVDRLRGLGNAVVPQVAEFIGRQILRAEELRQ